MERKIFLQWIALAGVLQTLPASASIIVSFNPTPKTAALGESLSIDIVAKIPASEAVVGWGLDYIFATPDIVTQLGFAIGPEWNPAPGTPDGDGLAGLAPYTSAAGVSGPEVLLATIQFEAIANGFTELVASDDFPTDRTEGFAIAPASGGGFAQVTYINGLVIVPSPSAGGLLLLGGLVLALRRRS